jgi:hypothetical protein
MLCLLNIFLVVLEIYLCNLDLKSRVLMILSPYGLELETKE